VIGITRQMGRRVQLASAAGTAVVILTVVLLSLISPASARSLPMQSEGDAARELAERFVPVIMVKEQQERCDTEGEPFWPMSVDVLFDNPEIALRQVSRNDPVVMRGPTAGDLVGLGEGFYLDFPGDSLRPGCVYERDFDKYTEGENPTVYAHVVQQPDEPDAVYLQYWFYRYYNDWNNTHESDWEGITLRFDASSVADALLSQPVEVGYSQHEGGERADWEDDKLSREGDRPVVYSSARSHASYFGSAFFLGRSASEGFGCDDTTGPSVRLDPDVVLLPDRVDDPNDPLAWLAYNGRWGERQTGAFNGPTGPASKDRWLEPAPYFEGLRASSVVIPAGNTVAGSVVGSFCEVVETGSGALIAFTTSPEVVLIVLALLVLLVRFLVGLTDWRSVPIEPIVRRRRAGQLVRAAASEYGRTPPVFLLIGMVYLPALLVTGALSELVQLIPVVSSFVSLAGQVSGTSVILAIFVGSFSNVAAFVVINGVVSEYLRRPDRGVAVAIEAIGAAWDRRRPLLDAFIRSYGIVFVLLASVVGAPWGIRQLIRYQFVAQTVMYEGRNGRDALARSSELVRGRWLHTAAVAGSLNVAVASSALLVSLILLVVVSGVPLWLFSMLVSLVYICIVPLAALALTLLYGDAVAEHEDDSPDDADREHEPAHQ
jgi:hypothetical protein